MEAYPARRSAAIDDLTDGDLFRVIHLHRFIRCAGRVWSVAVGSEQHRLCRLMERTGMAELHPDTCLPGCIQVVLRGGAR